MPRFTLTQLFMGTTLIAIVLLSIQTDGCGRRHTIIECLSFSADDSRIAVSKLRAGDAHIPEKAYMDDFVRTVSWLDVSTGKEMGIVHQDFHVRAGGSRNYFCVGRAPVLCNPSDSHIAMTAYGGGNVTYDADTDNPRVAPLQQHALNLAFSKSGRLLAASGRWEVTVLDTQRDEVVMHAISEDNPFVGASLMSFADDGASIIIAGDASVHVWDVATKTLRSTVIQETKILETNLWIAFIAIAPGDNVIIGANDGLWRYDFEGNLIATLSKQGTYLGSVAADGNRLATYNADKLTIYDLSSNNVVRTLPHQDATALALSSHGERLAVGDSNGRVTLYDIASGNRRWTSNPPERYRWPLTLPMIFLIAWIGIAWRLYRRKHGLPKPEVSPQGSPVK